MRKVLAVAGIAALVAVLGVVAIGAVAYAQDDGEGGRFDFGARFREAIAGVLDISVEEYDAAVLAAQQQVVDEALAEGALTEEQAERMQERFEKGLGPRAWDRGFMRPPMDKCPRGLRRDGGFMGRGGMSIAGAVTELLDLTPRELLAELQEGKTLAEVAEEKGVDRQDILDTVQEQIEETLAKAVDNGRLTQEQADEMLQRAMDKAEEQLDSTWEGRFPGRFPKDRRPGRMREVRGETDV
jgi:polyhydroxyalkanoate synthesis regulator phasin